MAIVLQAFAQHYQLMEELLHHLYETLWKSWYFPYQLVSRISSINSIKANWLAQYIQAVATMFVFHFVKNCLFACGLVIDKQHSGNLNFFMYTGVTYCNLCSIHFNKYQSNWNYFPSPPRSKIKTVGKRLTTHHLCTYCITLSYHLGKW